MQKEKDHSAYNIKSTEVARKDDLVAGSEKSDFVSKAWSITINSLQKEWAINLGIKMVISLSKHFLCVRH